MIDKPYLIGYSASCQVGDSMTRTFIMTREFDAKWKEMGLDDDELRMLQMILLESPTIGDRIPQTGGIRKYRVALEGRGKRGGARICYFDIPAAGKTYLLTAYAKNEKDNLSMSECKALKQLAHDLTRECKTGG